MAVVIVIALLAAFFFSKHFGGKLIPWLEKKGFTQAVKEEVEEKVYSEKNAELPEKDEFHSF